MAGREVVEQVLMMWRAAASTLGRDPIDWGSSSVIFQPKARDKAVIFQVVSSRTLVRGAASATATARAGAKVPAGTEAHTAAARPRSPRGAPHRKGG